MKDWCVANGISIGRDKLFNVLIDNALMIRGSTRKAVTTNSKHNLRRYSNIIKGIDITGPNQVWPGRRAVSDMTYLALPRGFIYMSGRRAV